MHLACTAMGCIRYVGMLGCLLAVAGCGSPSNPSTNTTTTSTASASTTTAPASGSASSHYTGTVTPPSGTPSPIDLSLFFNLPGGASFGRQSLHPFATYNVTGGFNTNGPSGTGGFSAFVEGTLDGTPLEGG